MRSFPSALVVLTLCICPGGYAAADPLPITGGTPVYESFDSLPATGTGTTLPPGWAFAESGNNANAEYAADDGSTLSGNTYSYGTSGSSDRALGLLQSGSLNPTVGVQLRNDTGAPMVQPEIGYTGELWRLGVADRGGSDRLQFQYSLDATSLTTGTWHDVAALNFTTPEVAGAVGARNGNLAEFREEISGILPITLGVAETIWLRWVDFNVSSNDDGLAIDDFHVGPAVDHPPFVLSITPEDGGTMPANGTIALAFSEPVTITGEWIDLGCTLSGLFGTDDLTIAGGPTSYTIKPPVDLEEDDYCITSLYTNQITDASDQPLDQPWLFDFTVTAPVANAPPEVVSTVPANGANGFPIAGDLVVTFSEPVTIGAGAFDLSCAASTGIVLDHPASGTTVAIGTGTALQFGDSCTFTIDASAITDAEGAVLVPFGPISFTVAADTTGDYYGQVNTSSPEQLRCSLHAIIKDHQAYPYSGSGTNTWEILNLADEDPLDSGKILDVYKNESYAKITGGTGAYNREHTWPNTYGFSSSTPGPYTDTHMLHLTNVGYNSDRGSKPFANCDSGCTQRATTPNHGIGGSSNADSNWFNNVGSAERDRSFEVWGAKKGNMARAVMYMAIRYEGAGGEPDLELTDTRSLITSAGSGGKHYMGLLTTLLEWHAFDPPDAAELERNEIVFGYQGNRNPFVDHPEWATLALFQSSQPDTCELGSANAAPVAVDDLYAAIEDMLLSVDVLDGVLDNDTDADSDTLVAELLAQAANGEVQLDADGSFDYTPAQDFCGTDTFTYRASDGQAWSAGAIATIEVECRNDAPHAVGVLADRDGQVGVAITAFGVAAGFGDVDGDTLGYSATGLPPGLSLHPDTGMVEGTPAPGADAASPYTVTVTASDGEATAEQQFAFVIAPAVVLEDPIFRNGFED